MKIRSIALFGSSQPQKSSPLYTLAYNIGRLIAKHDIELINGGYTGIMEASAKGAKEIGGRITGVTVKTFYYSHPNPYLTKEIKTENLFERLSILINMADFYIVLPGSTGTLVELSLIWEFFNKGESKKKALVDSFWSGLRNILPSSTQKGILLEKNQTISPNKGQNLFFSENILRTLEIFLLSNKEY